MQPEPSAAENRPKPPLERSHWVAFAGVLLLLSGLFDITNGFVALLDHGYYETAYDHGQRLLVFNYDAWGWIWIIVGIAQLLAGVGVLVGSRGARLTGIVLASACLVGQLMFLSAFPWWSVATMALSVLVIFGLVAEPRHVRGMRV
ncbi:DUF7144 family membrane protein [Streptomyces massasporeus]|uniref:DUF7144 family membrane protein n=1 Tax=Streptomyces massasporeus TaxID=67324 RepID=UPI0036F8DC33